METTNKPGEAKLERHRITLSNYGALMGQLIFAVEVRNIDADYNKKKSGNEILIPHFPIKLYSLKRIPVHAVAADTDANDNVVIIFNNDSSLRFPVTSPEIRVPTMATIKDAVRAYESKEPPIFFKDCAKATAEVIALNKTNWDKAVRLSKDMAQQAEGISQAIELDQAACEKYLSELETGAEVSITVEV